MLFSIDKYHFIGPAREVLQNAGMDPARQIVPMWFGFQFTLPICRDSFPIQVTGKSQFKLFVNGESVLFGPCRSAKDVVYVDSIDIAPQLKTGENHLLFQVFSYPEQPQMDVPTSQGPNYCYGDNDGPGVFLAGDFGNTDAGDPANWRVWIDEGQAFNAHEIFWLGANETVDGERQLRNPFLAAIWDESKLFPAAYGSHMQYDPYGTRRSRRFEPRPIPLLTRVAREFSNWQKCLIPPHTKSRFVLDMGELTTAYFRIGFEGGRGSQITLTYAESYYQKDSDGRIYKGVRDDASGFIHGVHDQYIVGGDAIYEPFRFRTFRFVQVEVYTGNEPLSILPQPCIVTFYPFINSKKPLFHDQKKEKLYDVAFRTLQLCAHDTYEDCPYYEQLMYACDARLEMLFTYASTDDTALPRHGIRLFASSLMANGLTQSRFPSRDEQIIPSFALWFVMMLEDYVNHTQDLDFVRPYIPIAERIVEMFLAKRTQNGLLAPQGFWDYFDWTREWSSQTTACTPTAVINGESTLQNLFFVYACNSLIRILPRFHRNNLATFYKEQCEELLRLVNATCWDSEKGLYREGPFTEEYSQHSQIYAVLSGLAQGEKAKFIMKKTLSDPTLVQCSFMQRYYLFRALEKVGLYHLTEPLWQTWLGFIDMHCTTFPETPDDPRSDCHAWSALPLSEFANSAHEAESRKEKKNANSFG